MQEVPEIRSYGFCALKTNAHDQEMAVFNMGRLILDWFEKDYSKGSAASSELVSELVMQWREFFREFEKRIPHMEQLVTCYENIFIKNSAFRPIQTSRRQGHSVSHHEQWWAVLEALYRQLVLQDSGRCRVRRFSMWLRTQKFLAHFLEEGLGSEEIFGKAVNKLQVSQFRLGRGSRRRRRTHKRPKHFLRAYCRREWRPSHLRRG